MKKINLKITLSVFMLLLIGSSCEEFLDINENPNQPTSADVQLVLPQAIVASASIANQFNSYGGHFGGFIANAGGFSGFGNLLSYNLTPGDWNGLWVNTYQDPLQDLKYVIDFTEGKDEYSYFNAAAKIITVVNYQRLVDAFGDIPYTEALRGNEGINAPVYDNAATVYQDLLTKLDQAISIIDNAKFPLRLRTAHDPLFGSLTSSERPIADQMLDWKRYANTLKLRILIRTANASGFGSLAQTFSPVVSTDGTTLVSGGSAFLDDDAIVDPGYEKNRPNPEWATWGRTTADALANSSRIPTTFAFAFYGGSGAKISDAGRGETIFVNYPATPTNQLGNEVNNPTIVTGQVTWASNETGYTGLGVLKGPGMGQPLMLKAESEFLLAEAKLKGFLSGGTAAMEVNYYNGIRSSFAYLFKDENEVMKDTTGRFNSYKNVVNQSNRLVNIGLAANDTERLEAIITQKYIAMNMITSDEAWNEYRRTGFPKSVPGGGPAVDIASNKSTVTSRPDRMPTRVLYPSSEQSYNASNYRAIDYASERIFWDPN